MVPREELKFKVFNQALSNNQSIIIFGLNTGLISNAHIKVVLSFSNFNIHENIKRTEPIIGSVLFIWGLVLTSAIVGAGPCACPNEGNHRGIAPTKYGRSYDQTRFLTPLIASNPTPKSKNVMGSGTG